MTTKLVHAGFGNYIAADRVLDVANPTSTPIQRVVRRAKREKIVLDLTAGRRTRSVIFLDTGVIVLAGIQPRRVWNRLAAARSE